VIASQSLISGAFTLAEQAIALNLFPRMRVVHTSEDERGQVYVPLVNAVLAIVCILLVVTFQSSARLAAMFGLAVSATMLATDIVFFVVATRVLHWKRVFVVPFTVAFALLDATFFLAGLPKFLDGAWVPLVVAGAISVVAITWLTGRRAFSRGFAAGQEPVERFLAKRLPAIAPPDDTIVMFTGDPSGVPFVRDHAWLEPLMDERQLVLLTINPVPVPYVDDAHRVTIDRTSPRFVRVSAEFGYMEKPRLEPILHACESDHLDLEAPTTSFIFADPVVVPAKQGGLPRWQRGLFAWLQQNSRSLPTELEIPVAKRVQLSVEAAV
jgi:KUP system potassium uptake protein